MVLPTSHEAPGILAGFKWPVEPIQMLVDPHQNRMFLNMYNVGIKQRNLVIAVSPLQTRGESFCCLQYLNTVLGTISRWEVPFERNQ
jgi:hypothetical protein